jgi:hypothetical protein
MTTFTITTPVNIDGLSTKTGSDVYNINGGYLTVDQDTRYGLNGVTSGCMGNTTISASLGGTVLYDARKVRLIPYDTGTGNVPAYNTVISQGSASGKMIGVYASIGAAPTAVGAAMPASGFIKVKQWNDVAYAAGALTGIGANATGPDVVGWIEIVGVESTTQTVPRLGQWLAYGDWFEVGTTTGNSASSYQLPVNGSAVVYQPAVQVETAPGSGVYEWWPCIGTKTAIANAFDKTTLPHNNVCWISTGGLLRFRNDGTNSAGGNLPESGRKIRIPNLIFNNCQSAGQTVNTVPNATLATRHDFTTTSSGAITMDKVMMNWYPSFTAAYSVIITNSAIMQTLLCSNIASTVTLDSVCLGQFDNLAAAQYSLQFQTCLAGGSVTDCIFTKANLGSSGHYNTFMQDCAGFDISNNKFIAFANRGNATTGSGTWNRVVDTTFDNNTFVGGRLLLTACSNLTFTNTKIIDSFATITVTTNPQDFFALAVPATNIMIDGVMIEPKRGPYTSFLLVPAGAENVTLRNIGTPGSPLNLGGDRKTGVAYSRSGTVATVTETGHGYVTGSQIYVYQCDSTAAIGLGAKTITVVDDNTFTFAATNAGATSGVFSYYFCSTGFILSGTSSGASRGTRVQRVYVTNQRAGPAQLFDNTNDSIMFEDVQQIDTVLSGTVGIISNNNFQHGVEYNVNNTALTAVYGMHFIWQYRKPDYVQVTGSSWARSGTTVTVTKTDHGLATNNIINIVNSSAPAPTPPGQESVTVVNKDTFTFAGVNTGATSGTLDYDIVDAEIRLFFNEPTSRTASQVTINSGTPGFTSQGGIFMPNVGDQVTWEFPKFFKGLSGFHAMMPDFSGGGVITNFDINYAIDKNDGNGYSSFKKLFYNRSGASGTSGASTFTVTDATGVTTGMYLVYSATGGFQGAQVTDVTGNTITLNQPNVANVSGNVAFSELPGETGLSAELGTKMKIRLTTRVANTAAVTHLAIHAKAPSAGRAYQYPLDLATLTLTGLQSGSDIVVLEPDTDNEYINVDSNGTTSYNFEYDAGVVTAVDIGVFKAGYVPFFIRNLALSADGGSVPVTQIPDRAYIV